ncbi:MATE efflux family protein [Leptospira fainei serovar Hurstbridge str. BUT 6]|uniref:MATE efflux family protein n=1 Tax=Leptospira fainei serovar Hurstbridge str. BUT 6 TaxID=1193011 RepID=S3V0U0_9LEPT|nr:MATE family efflux transporter [Leptospira fainei]EPG74234.1 MATE efflux family protein [Leptospira fainei serovar Hurstbridge str. BUT 6]
MKQKFFQLTFYNILANLSVPLAGLADTAVLGQLDTHTFMAGVALANIVFDYLFWSFAFLRMGTTGLTAQAYGAGDESKSDLILSRSLILGIGVGITILLFNHPIQNFGFFFLEGEADVKFAGSSYFQGRIASAPATLCNFVLMGWFLGRSQSKIVLFATVIANVTNILLDIWFVLYMNWQAWGAGIATTISQYLMLFLFLIFYFLERRRLPGFSESEEKLFSASGFRSLLSLNTDILLRTVMLITAFSIFRNFSSSFGSIVLAGNAILHELILVAAYWIDGAAVATETLAGEAKGKNDKRELISLLKLALISALGLACFFSYFVIQFPNCFFPWISRSSEVLAVANTYRFWLAPVLIIGSIAFVFDGFFLGLSDGRTLRNAMIVSTLIFFIPIALIGKAEASNHLLWLSLSFYMIGRSLTLGWKIYKMNETTSFVRDPIL